MRKLFLLSVIFLSSCSQNLWATPFVAPPATITLQPAGIIAPATPTETFTPAPTATVTETPIVVPTSTAALIVVPGPVMQLDSTYLYADGAMLAAVPAGEFIMGGAGKDNAQHYVTLSDYWIYRNEVTKGQYARCVASGKCSAPDVADDVNYGDALWVNDPIVGVTFNQASAYCEWVNASLPTEAQWEKAARGPSGNRYPWGNLSPTCNLLNFDFCVGQTTEVTQRVQGKSYYGALDMSGNVYEWVSDWYDESYFTVSPKDDPTGAPQGEKRTVRSSSFKSGPDAVQTFIRFSLLPSDHRDDVGFRCAVTDPTNYAPMCKQVPFYGVNSNGESIVVNSPNPKCAELSIEMGASCKADGNPQTVVVFKGPSLAVYNAPNCIQDSQLNIFTCYKPDLVSVCMDCAFPDLGAAVCLGGDHYQLKDNSCVWDGSATTGVQCPDGYALDSVSNCCTLNEAVNQFCPAGYYYLDKQQACVPYAAQSTYCVEKTVELKSCQ